jgi:hypothetical protein
MMLRNRKPIEAEWRVYAEQVIPFDAPDTQRVECRRAFYAGATALVRALGKLGPGVNPIEAYLAVFEGAADELRRFIEDGKAGRA